MKKCICCDEVFDQDLKKKFAEHYPHFFKESRSPQAILMNVDCHNAGLTIESFRTAGFCSYKEVDQRLYMVHHWTVYLNGHLEEWTVGPGGFFRDNAKECLRVKLDKQERHKAALDFIEANASELEPETSSVGRLTVDAYVLHDYMQQRQAPVS